MKNRIDLNDISFLIPARIDSVIRLENLLTSVDTILKDFDTHIYVLESNRFNNRILQRSLPREVNFIFREDWDPIFHRTKYINELYELCNTKFISVWDADVILPKEQILSSLKELRKGSCEVSLPYNGLFLDVPQIIREIYIESFDIDVLRKNISKMTLPYGKDMYGGAFFLSSEAFVACGKEDERFYGWGPEDWNRVEKWKNHKFRIHRADGPLFHLTHPRDINGKFSCDSQKQNAFNILEQTKGLPF